MSIGYANFNTVQQGQQSVVNNLASLGHQIGQSIENHAQVQAATAMLPALQQSYQQGMAKIASGDPNGMADIYSAASTASQLPILAPYANHAIETAQSANINAQHMARTQAYIYGHNVALNAKYPGIVDVDTGRANPNYVPPVKQADFNAQMAAQKNAITIQATIQQQLDDAAQQHDPTAYAAAANALANFSATSSKAGISPSGTPLTYEAKQKAEELNDQLQSELKKPDFSKTNMRSWFGGKNQSTIDSLSKQIQELHSNPNNLLKVKSSSKIPAVQGQGAPVNLKQGTGPVIPLKAIHQLIQNPNTKDEFDAIFGKGSADQILNPQSSIDTDGGQQVAETGQETDDEAEAVEG